MSGDGKIIVNETVPLPWSCGAYY